MVYSLLSFFLFNYIHVIFLREAFFPFNFLTFFSSSSRKLSNFCCSMLRCIMQPVFFSHSARCLVRNSACMELTISVCQPPLNAQIFMSTCKGLSCQHTKARRRSYHGAKRLHQKYSVCMISIISGLEATCNFLPPLLLLFLPFSLSLFELPASAPLLSSARIELP